MLAIITEKRDAIISICNSHKVRRLELFGSAAGDSFRPASSDIDLLVEFTPLTPVEHAEAYFGLQEELEKILERPVDLIERAPVRNPYFLESIDRKKVLLYVAA